MKRKIILILGCGMFAFHLIATFLYLAPANPMTNAYRTKLNLYMNPVFNQNWSLFAPTPATSSLQMLYRCDHGQWFDPLTPLYRAHHKFPLTYRGKLTYIYDGLIRELFNDNMKYSDKFVKVNDIYELMIPREAANRKTFANMASAIHDLCVSRSPKVKSFEFQIVRTYAQDFSKRLTKVTGRKEIIFFPPVEIKTDKGNAYASY